MGVFSRLNDQKDKLAQAEDAMPGAYENRYDQGIQDALAGMDSQNSAGFDFNSQNKDYRGALSRLFGNAGAGADAAAQVAQGLSGGYGADWAKSAADQSAASGAQDGVASAMAKARADALSQWQQELAGQSSQLDTLLGQDSLERSEYDGKVKSAQNWRGHQYDRTEQARTEKNNFLGNVWDVIQNVGSAVMQGYDAYKGYRQQDWENAFAERQYNDNLRRTELSDQMAALQQAAAYKQAGFDDAATQLLTKYGLDSTMLDAWQGLSQVDQDKLTYLTTAAGLAGSGYDTAAKSYLTAAGLDTGSIDYYDTVANRQNQSNLNYQAGLLKLQNQYRTTTGTGSAGTGSRGSRSGSSGTTSGSTTSKNSTSYSTSQLQTMAKEFKGMKEGDPLYDFYKQTLTDAGWLSNTGSTGSGGNWGSSPLTGTGNPGKIDGTPYEQGMYRARQWANNGFSKEQIAQKLASETGLSNDLVSSIMNQIEYEWKK